MDSARAPEEPDDASIRAGMQVCLRQWKVTCRELRNATLAAGPPVTVRPSWFCSNTAAEKLVPSIRVPNLFWAPTFSLISFT